MVTPVIMPRQGQSVESCIIGEWCVKVGDKVSVGDDLFTYETDKAAFEESAKVDGEILAIFFQANDDVPCLTNVCVIGEPGEDASVYDPNGNTEPASVSAGPAGDASSEVSSQSPTVSALSASAAVPTTEPIRDPSANLGISPRARALAKKQNVDLRAVNPSGPNGRVIERDIVSLIEQGRFATSAVGGDYAQETSGSGIGGRVSVADAEVKTGAALSMPATSSTPLAMPTAQAESYEEKHSNIRKLIAKSMVHSLSSMAQLTYNASFDASDILEFRKKLKKLKESGMAEQLGLEIATSNITINDIILYTVSRVVKKHKMCNAHYHDDKMVFFNTVNLGMAVDTPRGLMVPTIFNADRLSISEISSQAKVHSAACQSGTISPDQLRDGTITVSNLGALGIESFTPVINPPQTAILGVNCLETKVRDVGGVAVPYPSMNLSLTCDHRAIDGAPAARLLKDLKNALENFSLFLMN